MRNGDRCRAINPVCAHELFVCAGIKIIRAQYLIRAHVRAQYSPNDETVEFGPLEQPNKFNNFSNTFLGIVSGVILFAKVMIRAWSSNDSSPPCSLIELHVITNNVDCA